MSYERGAFPPLKKGARRRGERGGFFRNKTRSGEEKYYTIVKREGKSQNGLIGEKEGERDSE